MPGRVPGISTFFKGASLPGATVGKGVGEQGPEANRFLSSRPWADGAAVGEAGTDACRQKIIGAIRLTPPHTICCMGFLV